MSCHLTGIEVHISSCIGDWNKLQIAMAFSGDFSACDFQDSLQSFLKEYNENPEKLKCKLIKNKKTREKVRKKVKKKKNIIISTAFDSMEVI